MILIYTGNGKGKTSACTGQAIRALGHGKKVVFGQFFKLPGQAGEQIILKELLGDNFHPNGPGFYFAGRDDFDEHRTKALELLTWATSKLNNCFMLILDEAIYALASNLIRQTELEELIELCRKNNIHLVLSGRGLPEWLKEKADIVSELMEIKHPMSSGQKAMVGIEF